MINLNRKIIISKNSAPTVRKLVLHDSKYWGNELCKAPWSEGVTRTMRSHEVYSNIWSKLLPKYYRIRWESDLESSRIDRPKCTKGPNHTPAVALNRALLPRFGNALMVCPVYKKTDLILPDLYCLKFFLSTRNTIGAQCLSARKTICIRISIWLYKGSFNGHKP